MPDRYHRGDTTISMNHSVSATELTDWLRRWVATTTDVDLSEVVTDCPLENFGLSSRDAVTLSGELETLTGRRLDATIVYEYPTIDALVGYLTRPESGTESGPEADDRLARAAATGDAADRDIAVVGYAVRFVGGEDLATFWNTLACGADGLSPRPPEDRWAEFRSDPQFAAVMAESNLAGAYLKDIASFDAEYFGLSPVETENMDPQQRIILELAAEAFDDAGLPASSLRGSQTGVYVGSSNQDYGSMLSADPAHTHPYALTGSSAAIISNRVSYAFDFRGPSQSVDTACSSALVAIHQAVRALRDGDADVALAGGVNIMAAPGVSTAFGKLGVISPTGAIHAFSADADGFVRGDGAGLVVLKRVRDALADGDEIRAVIRGSAVNSDGHSNGLTAPNPEAQVAVLRRAYADAGIDPSEVDLVEAHGTGTILGDPIEAGALGDVLGSGRAAERPLLIGSAKTNFGHTESAAGAAGIVKVVEAMRHDTIPPSIHFAGPNPYIDFDSNHLEVVEDAREWPEYSGRKIAGVSGFGFGGTNAHVVLTDFRPEDYSAAVREAGERGLPMRAQLAPEGDGTAVLPVSGLVSSRRRAAAIALAEDLEAHPERDLVALERALARRDHARCRAVITASTASEAATRLRRLAEGKNVAGVDAEPGPSPVGPVFVYSGFGSQYRKMAKELMGLSDIFADRMAELDRVVRRESGFSMLELIEDDSRTYDTETAQVTITAIQIALTDLLAAAGARPAAVVPMSMGEIAAGYAAGGLGAEDALVIACHRARLMREGEQMLTPDDEGAMAVVQLSIDELAQIATEDGFRGIEPAVYTAPGMTTVGGPRAEVARLVERLEGEQKFARLLKVRGAGHTSMLDPILGELAAEISEISPRPLNIPLYSSVDRRRTYRPGETVHTADYFLRCTRQPVWFQDATEAALEAGHGIFVEISPNPVAIMGMMATVFAANKPDTKLLYTLKRKVPAAQGLRDVLAKLYVAGQPIDLRILRGEGERAPLPAIPWRRRRYWAAAQSPALRAGLPGVRVRLPDARVAFGTDAAAIPSAEALIASAAQAMSPQARVVASRQPGTLPATGDITTVVAPTVGGWTITVFHSSELVAEALAVAAGSALTEAFPRAAADSEDGEREAGAPEGEGRGPLDGSSPAADRNGVAGEDLEVEASRWDSASGETIAERLRSIVSESMGYEAEDLPGELPLIDLGLDSLMGMRIKNRIENDFQIPPLKVQELRDASVAGVIETVEHAVRHREAAATPERPAAEPAPATAAQHGVGVAPRDASERLVFAAWASETGAAAPGVTSELPELSEDATKALAARLSERSGAEISPGQVRAAATLADLADLVRDSFETDVEGNVRVLREREPGADTPVLIMFHPAGGSTVVYQPLVRRLPDWVPVYGIERVEGELEDRARSYVEDIVRVADGHPVVLGGWSLGGALAYEVAHQLRSSHPEVTVAAVALLDTVRPAHPEPDTPEAVLKRWERYSVFAKKTYGLDFPVPTELLERSGEQAVLDLLTEFLSTTDASEHGLSAGVLEHQRASFVDNRILAGLDFSRWADVDVPVLLFRAERMHDGAIELEPAFAEVEPDGGWGAIVDDLTIVQLSGDHLAVVDEPEIGIVGAHLTRLFRELSGHGPTDTPLQ